MVNGAGVAEIPSYIADLGDPTDFLFALSDAYIGAWYTAVMRLLFITSIFAAVLAFHNAVARYTFALGREGLLPEGSGHTHPRHLSPHVGSIAQSIVAMIVVAVFALNGQDAVLALLTWLTNLGTLGVIALMAATSFAVVAFFQRNRNLEHSLFTTLIAPIVADVALIGVVAVAVANFHVLIGNTGLLTWLLPSLLAVAAIADAVAAQLLKMRAPAMFASMGRNRE
jgi:amino acid transporter